MELAGAASLPATHLHGFIKTPNSTSNPLSYHFPLHLNRRPGFHSSTYFSPLHRRERVRQWSDPSITMKVWSVSSGPAEGNGKVEKETTAVESDEDLSAVGDDVIVLNVQGMMCGGCTASVKRILESKSQVSSAIVNLESESAVICVNAEAKLSENWQRQLGEELANHLTTCGFKTNLRVS